MSLLGVKGYSIYQQGLFSHTYPIDRALLIIPGVQINEPAEDIATVLKPIFDDIWRAGGYSRSLNYNDEGKRKASR